MDFFSELSYFPSRKDGSPLFGKKKPEYSTQVREYMSLLSEMGYTGIKGYIWYVYSGELENV